MFSQALNGTFAEYLVVPAKLSSWYFGGVFSEALLVVLAQTVAEPAPTAAPGSCAREWRRPADAPPQVAWCGRAVLAENLLLREAAPLFASASRREWEAAVRAADQARLAGTLGLFGLGASLTLFVGQSVLGALRPLQLPEPVVTAVGITALTVAFVGSFLAFVLHGLRAHAALELLEAAVRALP